MPNAKFEIRRKCECCGATFIAKTLDSHYCPRACSQKAYDKRMAEKKKLEQMNAIVEQIPEARDNISVQEAVAMFGISKDTIYRLIKKGEIPAINIGERLTRISKSKLGMVSQNTAATYFAIFKAGLKQAFVDGYLTIDLAAKVKGIPEQESRREHLTLDELNTLALQVTASI